MTQALAPLNGSARLAPDFRVRVNQVGLPPHAAADLVAVTVLDDVEAASMFTLRLINWDVQRLRVTWSDDALFAAGNEVTVDMGYVDDLASLIVGEITGLEPEWQAGEVPMVTVRGYDRRHRLLRGRKTRSFTQVKDSDLARRIAVDQRLAADVVDTGIVLPYVLQHNQTDLEFLLSRARRIGYEVVVDDRTLHFRPRQVTARGNLTLTPGDLIAFNPRLSTLEQAGQVAVRGWSPESKAAIVGTAAAGDERATMEGATSGPAAATAAFGQAVAAGVDRPVFSGEEAEQIARGRLNEMALRYITGDGICAGRSDLRAGMVVRVDGIGRRFSGLYYVLSTTHSYLPGRGYRTAFTVRRTAA